MRDPDAIGASAAGLAGSTFGATSGHGADLCPAALRALSLAGDALAQAELDAALIHRADRGEAWQVALGHLYQAMINLFAAGCAPEPGASQSAEADATVLHAKVMQHLRRHEGAAAQIEKLAAGDLQDVPPMGRLILFAALLRETVLAFEALPPPTGGEAGAVVARMDAKLRLLGDRVVAVAGPLLAGRGA